MNPLPTRPFGPLWSRLGFGALRNEHRLSIPAPKGGFIASLVAPPAENMTSPVLVATWEAGLFVVNGGGDDVLVSASVDPFAPQGAIYRRGADERGPMVRVAGGLPAWLDGKADTGCIAARGAAVAVADLAGNLYVSANYGRTWSRRAEGIPMPSSVLIA